MPIWTKRIIASGFIGLIILGNVWFLSTVTGAPAPSWTITALSVLSLFTITAGVFGCIQIAYEIFLRHRGRD